MDSPGDAPADSHSGLVATILREAPAPLDAAGARALTDRIKLAAGRFCRLLLEAHERRAWSALGYASWKEYVRTEFRLSRSRSYEILDHARVIEAIEAATGVSGIPDISPYAAGQLKPHLAHLTETIRARGEGLPRERMVEVAVEVVREVRSNAVARRPTSAGVRGSRAATADCAARDREEHRWPRSRAAALLDTLGALSRMPPPHQTLTELQHEDLRRLADLLPGALGWLTGLARACERITAVDPGDGDLTA